MPAVQLHTLWGRRRCNFILTISSEASWELLQLHKQPSGAIFWSRFTLSHLWNDRVQDLILAWLNLSPNHKICVFFRALHLSPALGQWKHTCQMCVFKYSLERSLRAHSGPMEPEKDTERPAATLALIQCNHPGFMSEYRRPPSFRWTIFTTISFRKK